MEKTFTLSPTNWRKSFYGKCRVNQYTIDGVTYSDLVSYTTRVAHYNHNTNEVRVYGWYSRTTAAHINAFLSFYGFDEMSKAQMLSAATK